jgi:leucine dehydrogenase
MFEALLHAWDGEEAVVRYDDVTESWMFIGVHSTVLGPAMGGTRLKAYDSPSHALEDVLRLSAAMTSKQAAAALPYGGGKAVIAVPEVPAPGSDDRRTILRRYADLVDSIGGTYVTAADMNTNQTDMDLIGDRTQHVLGRSRERGGSGDPAPSTAVGVFHGIVASARWAFGSDDLSGRTVLVQGVGAVGGRLVELLHEVGASVVVSDVDQERAHRAGGAVGAPVIEASEIVGAECDIYAPCATGAVLSAEIIPGLRCQVVAGAANNQLETPQDADRLQDAGILYAPDYVINAGGVIHLAGYERLGWDDAAVAARLAGIGQTLTDVFSAAKREGITTARAADRLAHQRLDAGPRPGA